MKIDEILHIQNLQTHFATDMGLVKAVDGVDFQVREGECLGLVGESGCGKTVTGLSILKLVPSPPGMIVGGRILFRGDDLLLMDERTMQHIRGNKISMIFQEPTSAMNPSYTIGNQMVEVIALHQKVKKGQAKEKAREMLQAVRIPDPQRVLAHYPHELSGGMVQRVMIGMALCCKPDVLIADEPTTSLDVSIQAQIIRLLKELKEKFKTSLIFITHDFGILTWICDTVAVMYAGEIVEYGSLKTLFENPGHPYTQALLRSTPRVDQECETLDVIPGLVPNLISPPRGCKFHPRCSRSKDICQEKTPNLEKRQTGHKVACFSV